MNTEITDNMNAERKPWVCYDAECGLCVRWAERFRATLEGHGFALMPLQSPAVLNLLAVPRDELLSEMRVITRDGRVFGGADALIYLSRVISKPLFMLTRVPGARPLLRTLYRLIARNRTCSAGTCPTSSTLPFRVGNPADWLPLLIPVSAAAVIGRHLAAWLYMWLLALAIFFGCKWLCLRRAHANGLTTSVSKKAAFFLAWIGMDAEAFFKKRSADTPVRSEVIDQQAGSPSNAGATSPSPIGWERAGVRAIVPTEWALASLKILLGVAFIWAGARFALRINPLLAGWTGMVGLILLLHFGLFHLLALAWRSAGVPVTPLMRAPLLSRSLGEFWGERWNTAFNELAARLLFRPLLRPLGVRSATMVVFLISGLIHDLIISVPARGGYGLPTLYFLLQGAGVLFERTKIARRFGLNRGIRAHAWTLLMTGAPIFWLFHPTFVRTVILPFLKSIGAT